MGVSERDYMREEEPERQRTPPVVETAIGAEERRTCSVCGSPDVIFIPASPNTKARKENRRSTLFCRRGCDTTGTHYLPIEELGGEA